MVTYVPQRRQALPWSTSFFRLPAEQQLAALAELETDVAQYVTDAGIRVSFSSSLVTATITK